MFGVGLLELIVIVVAVVLIAAVVASFGMKRK